MRYSTLLASVLTLLVALDVSAAVSYVIERVDDNTVLITGSGSLDAPAIGFEDVKFVSASTQTNDADATLTGDPGFGGVPFDLGGSGGLDDFSLGFDNPQNFSTSDGPTGAGGFTLTAFGFTVAPVGTMGSVVAGTQSGQVTIGSYEIVASPSVPVLPSGAFAALAVLLLGLLVLRVRRSRLESL